MKARIFIASSLEAVSVADKVREHFQRCYDVIIWNKNVFMPGEGFLDSLLRTAELCNFGIFVFAADDAVAVRGRTERVVRDNVVFECGMFFGRLGRKRSFFLVPGDVKKPTDLEGVAGAYYGGNRKAGIAEACAAIEKKIKEQLHKPEFISLNGKWQQTWRVPGTGIFEGENRANAEVLHIGDQFLANCDDPRQPFSVSGTLEKGFITGTWRSNAESLGYFGSFQLRIHPNGHRLEGKLIGFRRTCKIATGTWLWERSKRPKKGQTL